MERRPWRNFASMSGMAWVRRSGSSRVSSGWALQRSKAPAPGIPRGHLAALRRSPAPEPPRRPRARSKIQNIGRHIAYVVQLANIGRHTFSQHGPLLSPLTCLLLCRFLGFLALLLGVPRGVQCPRTVSKGVESLIWLAAKWATPSFTKRTNWAKPWRIFGSERQTALRDLIQQAPRRMACIREETRVKAHQLFERRLQLLLRRAAWVAAAARLAPASPSCWPPRRPPPPGIPWAPQRNRVDGWCQLHWRTPGGQRRCCLGAARQAVYQPFQLGHVFHGVHGHGRNCCVSRSQWARYAGHGSRGFSQRLAGCAIIWGQQPRNRAD